MPFAVPAFFMSGPPFVDQHLFFFAKVSDGPGRGNSMLTSLIALVASAAVAQLPPPDDDIVVGDYRLPEQPIVITYTRTAEPETSVPVAESLIRGDDVRARGATDLRGALSPAAGVEVLPGSDGGPASSVVAAQGLAEMDAYLLVVAACLMAGVQPSDGPRST